MHEITMAWKIARDARTLARKLARSARSTRATRAARSKKNKKKTAVKAARVKAVAVEVGELSGFTARGLRNALASVADWRARVATKRAAVECACGFRGAPRIIGRGHDFVVWACPKCGRKLPRAVQGDGVAIKKIWVN